MNGAGDALVTWESVMQDGDGYGVYGQRINSLGVKQGPEFRVNETTVGAQMWSSAAMTNEGNFVVGWISDNRYNVPGSTPLVFFRQYRADGTPISSEVQAYNPPSGSVASVSRLSVTPAGVATFAWRHYTQSNDVLAMRYFLDTQPVVTTLTNGITVNNIASTQFGSQYFKIDVPSGKSTMVISVSGPSAGNVDLYGMLGVIPSPTKFEFRSINPGNIENLMISGVPPGTFFFNLYGAAAYSGVTLKVTFP
jgi:hypothetical protein